MKLATLGLLGVTLLTLGCGDDGGGEDAGPSTDSGADSGGVDGGPGVDGGSGIDGGPGVDGGPGPRVDAGPAIGWNGYCTVSGPEREMRCAPMDTFDVEECQMTGACLETIFVDDVLEDVATCLAERDCGAADGPCYDPSTYGLTPSAAFDAYAEACADRRTTCAGDELGSEFCFPALASDPTIAAMQACLAEADCTDVRTCLIDIARCAG